MNKSFEIFRAKQICKFIIPFAKGKCNYLDYGCGDGFLTEHIVLELKKKNLFNKGFGYDIIDFRDPQIKKSNNFTFINNLSSLNANRIDLCTIVDVIHHVRLRKKSVSYVLPNLRKIIKFVKPTGIIVVKDYLLHHQFPLSDIQRVVLTLKDVLANPSEMHKQFFYLNQRDWIYLFEYLGLECIYEQPFYYLPFERYYSFISGQAWYWILQKK